MGGGLVLQGPRGEAAGLLRLGLGSWDSVTSAALLWAGRALRLAQAQREGNTLNRRTIKSREATFNLPQPLPRNNQSSQKGNVEAENRANSVGHLSMAFHVRKRGVEAKERVGGSGLRLIWFLILVIC